jgi:carboxyl-terminal processing protease
MSLNEAVRQQEKAADDSWRLTLENQLRAAKGEEPVASLEALEELQKAKADAHQEDEDAMLIESGNILIDYLSLIRQVALVENLPGKAATSVQ